VSGRYSASSLFQTDESSGGRTLNRNTIIRIVCLRRSQQALTSTSKDCEKRAIPCYSFRLDKSQHDGKKRNERSRSKQEVTRSFERSLGKHIKKSNDGGDTGQLVGMPLASLYSQYTYII
jgi:hypothetical protein